VHTIEDGLKFKELANEVEWDNKAVAGEDSDDSGSDNSDSDGLDDSYEGTDSEESSDLNDDDDVCELLQIRIP